MASVLSKVFDEAKAGEPVRLFKSHKQGIADGDQRRDFIYVDDVVAVVRWLLDTPRISGLFNVGTGKARSFREMIERDVRGAWAAPPKIEYVDMPEEIRGQYQYFTQSQVENAASRPAIMPASRRLKMRSAATSPNILDRRTVIADVRFRP